MKGEASSSFISPATSIDQVSSGGHSDPGASALPPPEVLLQVRKFRSASSVLRHLSATDWQYMHPLRCCCASGGKAPEALLSLESAGFKSSKSNSCGVKCLSAGLMTALP